MNLRPGEEREVIELPDLLDDDRGDEPIEFGEGPEGRDALDRWARSYDDLNGAPESDDDR